MRWIVFFDGECGFCSRSIRLLARLDRRDRIRLSPLQGALAQEKGLTLHADPADDSMVVYRESDGATFLHSRGWLEVGRALGFPYNVAAAVFRLVPASWLDAAYRWVAANRYRFFGKVDACSLPDESVLRRMV